MRNKEILDTTSNRGVYNRARKIYLEEQGEIICARCPYHGIENESKKFYGCMAIWNWNIPNVGDRPRIRRVRYPNWKLVSKNKKQWMKKTIKVKKSNLKYFDDYFELFF